MNHARLVVLLGLFGSSFSFAQTASQVSVSTSSSSVYQNQGFDMKAVIVGNRPTGIVTFRTSGGVVFGRPSVTINAAGVASATASGLFPDGSSIGFDGREPVFADYSGDALNAPAMGATSIEVKRRVSTTLAVVATPNQAAVGDPVTFEAKVGGFVDGLGLVRLTDNGLVLVNGGASPPGMATNVIRFSTAGTHTIYGAYAGSRTDLASNASSITVAITPGPSTVTVGSPAAAYQGNSVVLTATVTGPGVSPTGTVTFRDGATVLGSAALTSGKATFTSSGFSAVGSHSLTASYGGDSNYLAGTSPVGTLLINAKPATTTVLSTNAGAIYANQTLTMTATVTGAAPTGSVTFKAGATTLSTVALTAGKATLAFKFATASAPLLQAVYSGDASNAASSSNAVALTVNAQSVTSTRVTAPTSVTVGESIMVSAVVTGSTVWSQVDLIEGATLVGRAFRMPATAASAVGYITENTVGSRTFIARYQGTTAEAPSDSAPFVVTTTPRVTTTTLTAPSVAAAGTPVSVRVSVVGYGPTAKATLAVTQDGVTSTQSVTIGSVANVTLRQGVATLIASYPGDAFNTVSFSPKHTIRVDAVPVSSAEPVSNFEYDAQGNPTRVTVGPVTRGVSALTRYDVLDRPRSTTDGARGVTQFGFDGLDRPIYVADPRTLITEYDRDGLGNAQLSSPDTGAVKNRFDEAGNLVSATDARGAVTTFTYDASNRATSITHKLGAESRVTTLRYDENANGAGQRTSTQTPETSSTFSFLKGRVSSEARTIAPTAGANSAAVTLAVSYVYDVYGQLSTLVYPSGRRLSLTMNLGNLTSMSLEGATSVPLLTQIEAAPFGKVQSWNWSGASGPVTVLRTFDSAGRMVRYPLGSLMRDVKYNDVGWPESYLHFDPVAGSDVSNQNQTFTYDVLGRLTRSVVGGVITSYEYDTNGNRRSKTTGAVTRTFSTNFNSNAVLSATNPTQIFAYDAVGNTLSDGRYVATYSAANRLASVTVGGLTTRSTYDERGRRVRKFNSTGPASTVLYAYDLQDHLIGEYGPNGETLREYVWLRDTPVAMITPNAGTPGGVDVFFIYTDHLETPRVVVDKNGVVRWRWVATDPFGVAAPEVIAGGVTFSLRFAGQVFDPETGLHSNHHRDYDPSLGRYIQPDPIGLEGGLNPFVYVNNSPTTAVDADGRAGLVLLPAAAAIAAAVGALTINQSAKESRLKHELSRLGERIRDACRQCPPCDPVVGTSCWVRDTGHLHKGLDPHYHLVVRQQEPQSCKCSWDKKKDDKFTFAEAPASQVPCSSYPSYVSGQ